LLLPLPFVVIPSERSDEGSLFVSREWQELFCSGDEVAIGGRPVNSRTRRGILRSAQNDCRKATAQSDGARQRRSDGEGQGTSKVRASQIDCTFVFFEQRLG
jgi:hypothetical protein